MKTRTRKKTIVHIQQHLENLDASVNEIIRITEKTRGGYAGYRTKKFLKDILARNIVMEEKIYPIRTFQIDRIENEIREAMKKTLKQLPSRKQVEIHIFPTFSRFVKKRMFGVTGYTPYPGVFHIYLHPESQRTKKFSEYLRYTTVHEFHHSVRFSYFPLSEGKTLLDMIIDEGLAEIFRQEVLGGEISPWAKALNQIGVKNAWKLLIPHLKSRSLKQYYELFFRDNIFPLWTGYALGYQIVHSFRKSRRNLSWLEITKLSALNILNKSRFSVLDYKT